MNDIIKHQNNGLKQHGTLMPWLAMALHPMVPCQTSVEGSRKLNRSFVRFAFTGYIDTPECCKDSAENIHANTVIMYSPGGIRTRSFLSERRPCQSLALKMFRFQNAW